MARRRALLLATLLAITPFARGEETGAAASPPRRPKIGLALGGGGARGAAHIGVLKVLEDLRIPIDYIAGTSMGSVVGGLYVVGYTPEALEKVVNNVDWVNLFVDNAPRRDIVYRFKENDYLVPPGVTLGLKNGISLPAGLIAGRKLGFLLNTLTLPAASIHDFDKFSIPYRAVATDARTGEVVVLSKGSLPQAIRSSMAIPVVFTPVEYEGRSLIDGGTAQNLPVQTARAMGADVVIAVDVASSSEVPEQGPRSVADMLGRMIDLPLLRNTTESRPLADLVITPDLKGISSGDFPKMKQIIPKGEVAARDAAAKLSRWSLSPEEYAAWRTERRRPLLQERPILDAVVVDPIPHFDVRRIERVIVTKAGLPFNERVLQADMRRIAAMSLWQNVEFQLVAENGKNVLHIIATPKAWGPTYLSAGIDYEINASEADANWNLSLLLDATELSEMGADWKTGLRLGTQIGVVSKFYQPLDKTGRFFVAPRVSWLQESREIFVHEVDVARYRLQSGVAGVDVGLQLGHLLSLGQFSVGIERGFDKARRRVGIPQFPDADNDSGAFVANLTLDQLDNFWFPKEGWFVNASYSGSRAALGADTSFNSALLQAGAAHSVGLWTATVRMSYGDTFGSSPNLLGLFTLGGFRHLSGRPRDQLLGQTMALGVIDIRRRLTRVPGTIFKGVYLGATAELGNTWATRDQASFNDMHGAWSVYLTTDTLLGPMYFAYGSSGNKNTAVYLFLNRGF